MGRIKDFFKRRKKKEETTMREVKIKETIIASNPKSLEVAMNELESQIGKNIISTEDDLYVIEMDSKTGEVTLETLNQEYINDKEKLAKKLKKKFKKGIKEKDHLGIILNVDVIVKQDAEFKNMLYGNNPSPELVNLINMYF